jgi:hypothetical protein
MYVSYVHVKLELWRPEVPVKKRLAWTALAAAAAALLAVAQPWAAPQPRDPRVPQLQRRVARLEKLVTRLAAHEPELAVTTVQGPPAVLAAGGETTVDSSPCPVTAVLVAGAWSAGGGATPVASRPDGQRWQVVFSNAGAATTASVTAVCARPS